MNLTLWIIQVLLAIVFAVTGTAKITQPRMALAGRMHWVTDATDAQVKGIGLLEVLAAIGLVVPPVLHIATFLTPLAAVGVVLLMIGATITHLRLGERQTLPVNVVLLVLAALVALARFGPYPF
jgi:uncharacterized membrane protein YphA (DoxX/SURF4 family)